MRKICSLLVVGVIILLSMLSPSVYATEFAIYKCTKSNGKIKFQDFACEVQDKEQITFAPNDLNPNDVINSLREHEIRALERTHELQVKGHLPAPNSVQAKNSEPGINHNNTLNVNLHYYVEQSNSQQTGFINHSN